MELSHDSDLFAIIQMLNTFGKHSGLVAAYTELFGLRPLKFKTKKWRLLLEEMKRLFDSESFTFQKRTYRITREGVVESLGLVVHRNFTDGLDSHNYLKKIMIGISEREGKDKSRFDEKDLRRKEGDLMAGYERPGDPQSLEQGVATPCSTAAGRRTLPVRPSDEEVAANRLRVKGILKGIGG
jgi:hypothetical protein